jgi:hypothetical protein
MTRGVAQVVEHLLCKHKPLGLNPDPTPQINLFYFFNLLLGNLSLHMWLTLHSVTEQI